MYDTIILANEAQVKLAFKIDCLFLLIDVKLQQKDIQNSLIECLIVIANRGTK